MIEVLKDFPENVVALAGSGQVTKDEYRQIVEPAVEAALAKNEKIRLYYEVGESFEGIAPSAVWEDVKIGVEHLSRWERIAVVTDVEWIRRVMGFFSFMMPAEMRMFALSETEDARQWIASD